MIKAIKSIAISLLLLVPAGCGTQLVEFGGLDAQGKDAANADALGGDDATTNTDAARSDAEIDAGAIADAGDDRDASTDASSEDASSEDASSEDASSEDASTDAGPSDNIPPTVISTSPIDGAMNVNIGRRLVTATFSEPMDPNTLNSATFIISAGTISSTGTVGYIAGSTTATFLFAVDLEVDTTYSATITVGVTDVAGNAMLLDYSWSFMTSACAMAPVELGLAGNFAVLAGSTVTSGGLTVVTGDLGVSPGTAVTGFPPGVLTGALHAGDSDAALAKGDLTTAYNDAALRVACAVTVSGNLGSQTFTPGLYRSTSSLEISSGDLTLDALGDVDAVFIFQTASTLTTDPARQVILSGGAQASNVFWQIGTSATLGTTSVFQGTIMADQSITLTTGAVLNGRALARIGAVTMQSNIIVRP